MQIFWNRTYLLIYLCFLHFDIVAQARTQPIFHPYLGRRVQTYMGPTAVQHPYADNRELKYRPQDMYVCEPIFALLDKYSYDKTIDLECFVFPYVYDPKEKVEVARLEELRRNECFQLAIAECELNDKKVWKIKSETISEPAQCEKLVASKNNKTEAEKHCRIQTSDTYKAEQKRLKELADQKKQAEIQAAQDRENSFSNQFANRAFFDAGYETQGRYTLGFGYSLNKIVSRDGVSAIYPFLQVATNNRNIESYSLGVRLWAVYMLAINYHMAYEKVVYGRDRLGLEAGLGALAITPFVGLSTEFKDEPNLRLGVRIILNSVYF